MNEKKHTIVIGITGGIGCGKSAVAEIIKNLGYQCLSTDDMAKELMNSSVELKNNLIQEFGNDIYFPNGKLNIDILSYIVFGSGVEAHDKLLKLNQIVHPMVIDKMLEETDKLEAEGYSHIFIESALIYEAGLEDGFDFVIVIDTTEEIAIERVLRKTSQTIEQIKNRMNEQISNEEKRKLADFVINNNATIEDLRQAVEFLLNIILSIN